MATRLSQTIPGLSAAFLAAAALVGCMEVGPDYQRPTAIVSAQYKEIKGWKPSRPRDGEVKGAWWRAFRDAELNRLAPLVAVSNQTLKADEANYRQALALVAEARAGLFPTLTGNGSLTHSAPGSSNDHDQLVAELNASWAPDLWGKVRRQIEQQGAAAEVSADDLANATLSAQSSLALAYVTLREADSARELYAATVKQYQRSLQIAQNQYAAGIVNKSDVISADALVLSAQASERDTDVARQQSEHAIAVLIGRPPAELAIARGRIADMAPTIPPGLPSELLQRRPDIAAAERAVAEQSAAIGVAIAGYFPSFTLSGYFGYSGDPFVKQIGITNPVWAIAASLAQPIFNGGLTDAEVAAARAAYDAAVATYRQTTLAAIQQVEDQLVALRVYGEEIKLQTQAVAEAEQAAEIARNQYAAGTQTYTAVATAEGTALTDEQTLLSLRAKRLTAAVNLIVALGGGWSEAKLAATP